MALGNVRPADCLLLGIRRWFGTNFKSAKELDAEEDARLDRINEERRIQGRKPLDVPKKLKDDDVVERK